MEKENILKSELSNTMQRLLDNPQVSSVIEDASIFALQTNMTPWAESPFDPISASIIRKYQSTKDWDAFCLAVQVERLVQQDGPNINRR